MTTYTNDIYGVQQQIADEQAATEKSFLDDSYKLASVQGGMMLANARDIGRGKGNMYAGLGRMLTGEKEAIDPRIVRMQKLQAIMQQIPEPDTVDEYIQLSNLMNQAELYGEAKEAMKMANDIRSQLPTKSTAYKEYSEMTTNPNPEGFKEWYKEFKITGSKTPLTAKQEAFKQYQLRPDYKSGKLTAIDFEREWSKAGREEKQPDNMTAKNIALQEFLVSPEYQGGKKSIVDFEKEWNNAGRAEQKPEQRTAKSLALEKFLVSLEYLDGTKDIIDFETEWSAAGRAPVEDTQTRLSAKEQSLDNFINSSDYIGKGGTMTIMDWNKKWTESGQSANSTSVTNPETIAKTNILNSKITESFDILSSDPANRGMPQETLLSRAKVIGSDEFLKAIEDPTTSNLNTSADVGDFEYWKGRYPEKTDAEIFEIMAAMNASSPYNVNINQTRAFNRESIGERTNQIAQDSIQVETDLIRTEEMLRAYEEGAKSGWGQTWINTGNKIAQEFFGLPQEEGTVQTDRLEQLFKDYTLDRMAKLKGTPSDKDLDLVERAGATMDRSRAANTMIIEFDRFLLNEQKNQHDYMSNWLTNYIATENEYPAGYQWDAQINQFRNRNDKSKWKGKETDRLALIQAYGTNEFDEQGTLEAIEARQTQDEIEINQISEEISFEKQGEDVLNRYGIKG